MNTLAHAAEENLQDIPFLNQEVTFGTDVHFNEKHCTECHLQLPSKGGETFLRFSDYTATCRCHGYTSENYSHPVNIPLPAEIKEKMPPDFPLQEGKITCNTCHAIEIQCDIEHDSQQLKRKFLRRYSFQSRTALCFQCHEESNYKRLDPHEQLDEAGEIIEEKCLYCHEIKPDEKQATLKKQRRGAPGTVEFVAELSTLCFRCHFRQTKRHIVNMNHLQRPPAKIRANMLKSERKLRVILPLDDAGSITCATCHNPHQRGVIPFESPGAKGASEKSRLRVTNTNNQICKVCHYT